MGPTVSAGFHFAKKKKNRKNVSFKFGEKNTERKENRKNLLLSSSKQFYFYKLKEARSTSFLKIEAEYNQRKAKSVELLL